jgi:hypothetical protein
VKDFLLPFAERRAARHMVRVDCQVVRERDFTLIARRTLDVSSAGMLVAADMEVLTGEPVIVSFRPPRTDRWIDAEATVCRVVHGRRPGDLGRALGLQFQRVEHGTVTALKAALRRMPPTRSRRPPRVDYAATIRQIASFG